MRISKLLHEEVRHDDPLRVCIHQIAGRLQGTEASLTASIADILAAALQQLIEAELTGTIGAEPGERTPARTAQRNGHRPKLLSTPAGDLDVQIPKLRKGSFFPELLEPRRRIDNADGSFTFEATGERLWRSVCLEQAVSVGTPPARDPEPCGGSADGRR